MKQNHDFNFTTKLSEPISAKEFLNHNKLYNSVHHTKNKQQHIISAYSSGVYIILDKNKEPIYVGKSSKLRSRILTHLNPPSFTNSTLENYLKDVNKYIETYYIMFSEIDIELLDVFEVMFIQKYKPKYNIAFLRGKRTNDLVNLQYEYSNLQTS